MVRPEGWEIKHTVTQSDNVCVYNLNLTGSGRKKEEMPSVKEESPKDVCWRFKTQHIFNGHPLSFYRGLSTIHPSSSSRGLKEGHRVAERMDPYPVWIWCQKDPSNGQVLRINHQIQLSPWSKGILWRVLGADPFKDYARLLWNNHRMRKPCITLKGQLIITFNHLRPCCFVFWWAAVSREASLQFKMGPFWLLACL